MATTNRNESVQCSYCQREWKAHELEMTGIDLESTLKDFSKYGCGYDEKIECMDGQEILDVDLFLEEM